MANIYDVNAAIAKPDLLGSFREGQQYGMKLRAQQQAQQDEHSLRGLAPQVVAGDPSAYERAAAIDPQAAGQYDAANVNMAKRAAGAASYMLDAVKRGNPQEIQGRYQAVLPFLTKLGQAQGKTPPPQFDPAMVPAMEQLVAMSQGMGQDANATPAGFQELHMKALAAGLQPGTPEYQQAMNIALGREGRAATGGFGFQKVVGADGRERMGRQNPRTGMFEIYDEQTGDFVPMGGGGALNGGAPMGQPSGVQLDNRPYTLDPDMAAAPSPVAGAITQQEQAAGNRPWTAATPNPYGNAMPRSSLGVSRSPEEQAALTTGAQEQVKLGFLPQQEAIKTRAAIEQAGGIAQAKGETEARIEAIQALPRVMQESNNAISLIDKALNHPGREAATGLSSLNPLNRVPGSPVMDFQVLLDQIKGGTFLQAFQLLKGGGAITQVEGTKAEQAIARLNTAQSDEAFVEALQELRKIAEDAFTRAQDRVNQFPQQSAPQSAPQRRASDSGQYQVGQVIEINGKRYRVTGGDPNDPDVEEVP